MREGKRRNERGGNGKDGVGGVGRDGMGEEGRGEMEWDGREGKRRNGRGWNGKWNRWNGRRGKVSNEMGGNEREGKVVLELNDTAVSDLLLSALTEAWRTKDSQDPSLPPKTAIRLSKLGTAMMWDECQCLTKRFTELVC